MADAVHTLRLTDAELPDRYPLLVQLHAKNCSGTLRTKDLPPTIETLDCENVKIEGAFNHLPNLTQLRLIDTSVTSVSLAGSAVVNAWFAHPTEIRLTDTCDSLQQLVVSAPLIVRPSQSSPSVRVILTD